MIPHLDDDSNLLLEDVKQLDVGGNASTVFSMSIGGQPVHKSNDDTLHIDTLQQLSTGLWQEVIMVGTHVMSAAYHMCNIHMYMKCVAMFAWLPTGIGKSICHQVLPFHFDHKLGSSGSVMIVLSPLPY